VSGLAPVRLLLVCVALQLQAESLEAILARMDRSAKDFKSLSAKMKQSEFTAVLNESSESRGEVRLKRGKNGLVGVEDFQEPEPRVIHLNGRVVERYFPKANTVEEYNAEKFAKSMDHFLLIGFGTSGTELKKEYDIKVIGPEMVGPAHTTHLELAPRSKELRNMITRIDLWIQEGQSSPIQEKVTQPSKDYVLISYSDLKVNPDLPDSAFDLKLPEGVKRVKP
jgi:outer membrane lipoprotein-sorting protein